MQYGASHCESWHWGSVWGSVWGSHVHEGQFGPKTTWYASRAQAFLLNSPVHTKLLDILLTVDDTAESAR